MSRIGIAISGGPNPAEIIDLVVLAETLVQRFHETTPIKVHPARAWRLTEGPGQYEWFHGIAVLGPGAWHIADHDPWHGGV